MSKSALDALNRLQQKVENEQERIIHFTDPDTGFQAILDSRHFDPILQVVDPATHNLFEYRVSATGLVPIAIYDVDGKQLAPLEIGKDGYRQLLAKNKLIAADLHRVITGEDNS